MMRSPLSEFNSIVQESLFRVGEKKRLNSMKEQLEERESRAHADLLSQVRDNRSSTSHRQSVEHNGLNFWNYYFDGEHPSIDQPLPDYLDEAWDENLKLESHTINPPFTRVIPAVDGVGESDESIEKRWIRHVMIGQAAHKRNDFLEAERFFRLSLDDAEKLDKCQSRQMAISAKGLADALIKQGRVEEADPFFSVALLIDEQLFGSGEVYLESEFYEIAKHFVDEANYDAMEVLFEDLKERLRMSVGRNDPTTARCLNELAVIYCRDGKWNNAEPLFARCLEILSKITPLQRNQIAAVENNFGALCEANNRNEEAEAHYRLALIALGKDPLPAGGLQMQADSSVYSPVFE